MQRARKTNPKQIKFQMLMFKHNLSTTPFIIQIFINFHNFPFDLIKLFCIARYFSSSLLHLTLIAAGYDFISFYFRLNFSLHQNKTIKITHQCFSLSICSLQIVFYCMLGLHLFLMIMAISFRLCLLVRYVKSSPNSC